MLTLPSVIQQLQKQKTQRTVYCYRIERSDATFVRFTTHNCRLEVNVGTPDVPVLEWFEPVGAPSPESNRKTSGMTPEHFTSAGPIAVDAITVEDVRIGLYEKAELHLYIVDWRYPFAGRYSYERFFAGEAKVSGETIEIQWLGLPSVGDVNIGRDYNRQCPYRLGGPGCGVDLAPLGSGTQTVEGISGWAEAHPRKRFRSSLTSEDDQWWQFGRLYWLTGNNAINQRNGYDVKRSIQSGGEIELWVETPYDIEIDDEFRVEPGCDKTKKTCFDKFDNVANFGGFPWMKPADAYIKGPKAGK